MKWSMSEPADGDERVVVRFALLPVTMGWCDGRFHRDPTNRAQLTHEVVWLSRYLVTQRRITRRTSRSGFWYSLRRDPYTKEPTP